MQTYPGFCCMSSQARSTASWRIPAVSARNHAQATRPPLAHGDSRAAIAHCALPLPSCTRFQHRPSIQICSFRQRFRLPVQSAGGELRSEQDWGVSHGVRRTPVQFARHLVGLALSIRKRQRGFAGTGAIRTASRECGSGRRRPTALVAADTALPLHQRLTDNCSQSQGVGQVSSGSL